MIKGNETTVINQSEYVIIKPKELNKVSHNTVENDMLFIADNTTSPIASIKSG